ncbi:phage tail-collar fiber domain-containing protein [Aeromonas sp. 6P]|uniref:phage tail-collar fiber domain-containing protein n=1 Tax=Aeromonas sp. 6P TaxID=3452722 RepID=UPI003F79D98A
MKFILADIPNLDITSPIDPDTGLPPESQIVHRQNVDQRGRINNNAVAYTIVMDTTVGDFSFNAMYLRNKQNGVIGMIVYKGRETKLKTDQTTGQTGNSLVKSMLMGYDQAAEATLTHVDAGTWQIDYAARLRGMDEDIRQLQADLYGHHTFVGDGFKVVEKDGAYQVSQGVAIIGGLRVELKAPEVIHPGTKPIGVWVDVHRAGSLLSEHQNHFTIITSVADLADHVDSNGYQHYVAQLGTILADSTIEDGRSQNSQGQWLEQGDVVLRRELSLPSGASLIGGVITPITSKFLAGGAIDGKDSTAAITAAGEIGGTYYVPKGTYIIESAMISKDTTFIFEVGASFKRASGLDIRKSYWDEGVPMIDAIADGLTITFIEPTFDGNKLNQPVVQVGYADQGATTEPAGWTFRYTPVNADSANNCRFNFIRPTFKNGTSGYLLVRGDDVRRRFKTEVVLQDPKFTDTIYGYGKGDPETPTALGWNSDYVTAYDYVDIYTSNLDMEYSAVPTPVGRYAPVGIRCTFYGSDVTKAGGVSIYAVGKTTLKGLGRKSQSWDGSDFKNSNGIGAIDGYGDCRNFYFDAVAADDCENVPLRAKATISNYYVNSAVLRNCRRGLQVSPAASGVIEGNICVGSVEAYGGWNPQLEFVGNTPSDKLNSVKIGSAVISGGVNGEGATGNIGGVVVRNAKTLMALLEIKDQDNTGFYFNSCDFFDVNVRTENTAATGVTGLIAEPCNGTINSIVKKCVGYGMTIMGECSSLLVSADVDGATDYGSYVATNKGNVVIDRSSSKNISGLGRGYYLGPSHGTISNSSVDQSIVNPVAAADLGQVVQSNNSWNARSNIFKAGIGAPTTGKFRKGDMIYVPPVSSGYIGWVCSVAGDAGSTAVFKRFGSIEA